MMPKMSGVETLQKMKEELSDFDIPVIALTAKIEPSLVYLTAFVKIFTQICFNL